MSILWSKEYTWHALSIVKERYRFSFLLEYDQYRKDQIKYYGYIGNLS